MGHRPIRIYIWFKACGVQGLGEGLLCCRSLGLLLRGFRVQVSWGPGFQKLGLLGSLYCFVSFSDRFTRLIYGLKLNYKLHDDKVVLR